VTTAVALLRLMPGCTQHTTHALGAAPAAAGRRTAQLARPTPRPARPATAV